MPLFKHICDECGITFEAIQTISANSGFILKESGWYTSEYPSESRKKGWEQESTQGKTNTGTPASAPSEPVSAKTPDTKPAAPAKKPSPKNPYSGGKSKQAKGSK